MAGCLALLVKSLHLAADKGAEMGTLHPSSRRMIRLRRAKIGEKDASSGYCLGPTWPRCFSVQNFHLVPRTSRGIARHCPGLWQSITLHSIHATRGQAGGQGHLRQSSRLCGALIDGRLLLPLWRIPSSVRVRHHALQRLRCNTRSLPLCLLSLLFVSAEAKVCGNTFLILPGCFSAPDRIPPDLSLLFHGWRGLGQLRAMSKSLAGSKDQKKTEHNSDTTWKPVVARSSQESWILDPSPSHA